MDSSGVPCARGARACMTWTKNLLPQVVFLAHAGLERPTSITWCSKKAYSPRAPG